jgi:hypothetical protein
MMQELVPQSGMYRNRRNWTSQCTPHGDDLERAAQTTMRVVPRVELEPTWCACISATIGAVLWLEF